MICQKNVVTVFVAAFSPVLFYGINVYCASVCHMMYVEVVVTQLGH